jgi:hypothetical protein
MAKQATPRAQQTARKPPPKQKGLPRGDVRGGVPGDLGCDKEFTVVGRGEGPTKQAALRAAHKDAEDTAAADCQNRGTCKSPVLVRGAKADATPPAPGKSTAVVEDVYKCKA